MPDDDPFFRRRQPAAAFKHGIVARYPVVFASKAGSVTSGRVAFLDGYAGAGRYDDGSPGSPLLFVRAARSATRLRRQVRAMFVEQDLERYALLCSVLAQAADPGLDYRTVPGDLGEHLPELLPQAGGSALFAFLDPFGTALDRVQLRDALLGRPGRAPTEVLLNFSTSRVARIGGILRNAHRERRELPERDRRTVTNLDRFLGGTWWQDSFRTVADEADIRTATEVALDVADRYCDTLCAETSFRFVSMPVRPGPGHAPKYVLVLFTRHVDGVWEFASTLGHAGRDWLQAWENHEKAEAERHGQLMLPGTEPRPFDPEAYEQDHRDEWTDAIAENIKRLLVRYGNFPVNARTVEVYGSVLGQAWKKHIRRAVKKLHVAGAVTNDGTSEFHRRLLNPLPSGQGPPVPRDASPRPRASGPRSDRPDLGRRPSGFDHPTV